MNLPQQYPWQDTEFVAWENFKKISTNANSVVKVYAVQ